PARSYEVPEPEVSRASQMPDRYVERPISRREDVEDLASEAPSFYGGQKVRFGLFGKIITVMLIVSLLPFAIFWGITLRETNERIRTDTEALMAQTARGLGNQVDGWINNNVSILRTAANLPEIITMDGEQQKPILETIQKQYPWMYLVFTVGTDGMEIARNDDVPLKDYSDRQYYKSIMRGKNLSWQTLIGKTSKKPSLVLAVPIKSENQTIGIMAAAMTVDDISKNIATWKKGKTGYAFLVDEKGYVISHPNRQYIAKRKNLNSHPLIANYRKKGWTTITTRFNMPNDRSALGHVRSNNYGWALALQQEEEEVFSALNRVQKFALTLLGCTILLVAVIAWFSARAIVTPMMKLTDAAERMSLGELNVKIDIKSRDEIGLLAQAIGRMQTSLRLAMNRLRRKR
ncbi:MAG: HAMP domain-containing protein, partial [Desulfobacterales bacterium]|nr:HAMP domain-containing protein [Desulfobacterales bacterium]